MCTKFIYFVYQKCAASRTNPKPNKRYEIIKGVQDSYAMSGEPVDAKATVANAKQKSLKIRYWKV